jgi:hypothetical protein
MQLPNIAAMYLWVNNFMSGSKAQSQDFLQLARQSDGTVLGWIDETGTPRGSLANPPSSLAGPGFIFGTASRNNHVRIGAYNYNDAPGFTSGSGSIGGFLFFLPTEITTSNISFPISNLYDASDEYDIGIYGPYTGVETTLELVCHTGPTIFGTPGIAPTTPWLDAPVGIPAGYYFLMFTTGGNLQVSENALGSFGCEAAGGPVNGVSDGYFIPTVSTTSTASTLPSTIALSVAFGNAYALYGQFGVQISLQIQFALF